MTKLSMPVTLPIWLHRQLLGEGVVGRELAQRAEADREQHGQEQPRGGQERATSVLSAVSSEQNEERRHPRTVDRPAPARQPLDQEPHREAADVRGDVIGRWRRYWTSFWL